MKSNTSSVTGCTYFFCSWSFEGMLGASAANQTLFPPASAVEGIKSVPSVCESVCLLVTALTAEPFDLGSRNLVGGMTLI